MRLDQMRAIAHDLGKPEGELAPLRGAGGSWLLHLPPKKLQILTVAAPGNFQTFNFGKLVGIENEPQLMERWSFVNLRTAGFIEAAKLAAAGVFTVELVIRRNGDLVFATSTEVAAQLKEEKAQANFIFNVDLFNAFTLDRGQQLQIEVRASSTQTLGVGSTMTVALGEVITLTGTEPVDSTLAYNSATLTGHRVIA